MTLRTRHFTVLTAAFALAFASGSVLANDPPTTGHDKSDSAQPVDDTWITTKVKASLLADDDVSGLTVEVETVNGVVTLDGNVESQAQIDKASQLAKGIKGVTSVDTSGLRIAAAGN